MKPITSYAAEHHFRVILQGPPGSGKTCVACQFPRALVIDLDRNLAGPLRWMKENNMTLPVGFDHVDTKEDGTTIIPMKDRCDQLAKILNIAQGDPNIDTVVLDSGTMLADILIANTLKLQGKNEISDYKDGRQFWNFFAIDSKRFLATLVQLKKHVVLVVHERTNKDAAGNVVYPIKIAWPGQVGEILGAFFTDVWRCETKISPKGPEYVIRTTPNFQYALKNGWGLPETFTFNWEALAAKVK